MLTTGVVTLSSTSTDSRYDTTSPGSTLASTALFTLNEVAARHLS